MLGVVSAFLAASVDEGTADVARAILGDDPDIAQRDLRAAAVLGDVEAARRHLDADRAVAIDDERGWPPLLYACYSRWHQVDPGRAAGLADVVGLLVDSGASPDTNDGGRARFRSALKGSVEVNNPLVTQVLLDRGAHPDPGQPIAEAAGHPDHQCLRLLLDHGARIERTWAVGAAVFHDDAVAASLLLRALPSTEAAIKAATDSLLEAAAGASAAVVGALLDGGADPDHADDGVSALRVAVRSGRQETAALLLSHGATDDVTDVDRFVGACVTGDQVTAERLGHVTDQLSDEDHSALADAAGDGRIDAVTLMLDLGFPPNARQFGEAVLHTAAYGGHAGAVRLLLERGAEVDIHDDRFEATPLAFATVGSGEQTGKAGSWVETVQLLLDTGASREGVWIADKPPSDEVGELLRRNGVTPAEPPGDDLPPASVGTGVMADLARNLEAAYQQRDLALLESLLAPDVTWTGLCRNRQQVLEWYGGLHAEGVLAWVESVEVDRDAVILEMSVSRPAEGARQAAPQSVFQVLRIAGGQVVDIRGFPDRASARTRQ